MSKTKTLLALSDSVLFGTSAGVLAKEIGCTRALVSQVRTMARATGRANGLVILPGEVEGNNPNGLLARIRAIYAHKVDVAFLETLGRGEG